MRWLKRLAFALVALEALYVLTGALVLRSRRFRALLNASPQSLEFEIGSAWSPFPGVAFVRNLDLRMQDANVQFLLHLDRARVHFSFLPLLGREFRATRVEVDGATFALRLRRQGKKVPRDVGEALPDIPGLSLTAVDAPKPSESQPEKDKKWHAHLSGVHVGNIRELWVEEFHFRGSAEAAGAFFLRPGKEAEITPVSLAIHDGHVTLRNRETVSHLKGELHGGIDHFLAKDIRGSNFFDFISARARFAADVTVDGAFDYYLRGTPWLKVRSEKPGALTVQASLDHGRLLAGSALTLTSPRLRVAAWSRVAEGNGRAAWSVTRAGKTQSELTLELPHYEIHRAGSRRPEVVGNDLALRLISPDLELAHAFEHTEVEASLPRARIVDLKALNSFLPRAGGLRLVSGNGWVEGALESDGEARGKLAVTIRNCRVDYGNTQLVGNVVLRGKIPGGNARTGIFDISGTELEITRADVLTKDGSETHGQWWGVALAPRAFFRLKGPVAIWGEAEVRGKDARPVLAFLSEHRQIPSIVEKIFSFDDLEASGLLRIDDHRLQIRDAVVTGGSNRIRGWLLKRDRWSHGRLLVEKGPFEAGLAVDGSAIGVHLLNPARWFAAETRKSGEPLPPKQAE